MKLSKKALEILNEIHYKTGDGSFMTLNDLEITFGISGASLRPFLEDLKEEILIVENEEGFQISDTGKNFSRSRWL